MFVARRSLRQCVPKQRPMRCLRKLSVRDYSSLVLHLLKSIDYLQGLFNIFCLSNIIRERKEKRKRRLELIALEFFALIAFLYLALL